jgi:hypothetical protein
MRAAVVLEAEMTPAQVERLAELMREHLTTRPPGVELAALLVDGSSARLVAFWGDGAELDAYLASVDEPRGVQLMREAGVEPTWRVVEVPQLG